MTAAVMPKPKPARFLTSPALISTCSHLPTSFQFFSFPSCLHCCCSLLLAAGAHLPLRGPNSGALLCSAVSEGDLALLRRMLHAGADPNIGDYDKRTALHVAAADCNLPVVSAWRRGLFRWVLRGLWVSSGLGDWTTA
jgi:hypothetical protein